MATPQEFIDNIISNALDTADNQTEAASDAADDLIRVNAGFYLTPPDSSAGFAVEAVEPEIPTAKDSTYTYEVELEKLIALLSGQLASFFQLYYPLSSDAFDEATTWLVNTITVGGTGIRPDIEDQTWQRDRERIITEGNRLEAQVTIGFAAKGIMLPAGAMNKQIRNIRQAGYAEIGKASTTIAVEQLKIEIETIKFAVGKALESRQMAMQAAADYIRAIASAPDAAARVAALNSDVQAKMMAAAASFYGVRLDRDKIVLTSKLAEMESRDTIYRHRRDNATQNDQVKVQALAAAADVFARTASAALSSLNSIVSSATNAFA